MSRTEKKFLSEKEETLLAFDGLLDSVGATALVGTIKFLDEFRSKSGYAREGYVVMNEEEPGDPFAQTVYVDEKNFTFDLGLGSKPYTFPRDEAVRLIEERLTTEQQAGATLPEPPTQSA